MNLFQLSRGKTAWVTKALTLAAPSLYRPFLHSIKVPPGRGSERENELALLLSAITDTMASDTCLDQIIDDEDVAILDLALLHRDDPLVALPDFGTDHQLSRYTHISVCQTAVRMSVEQ